MTIPPYIPGTILAVTSLVTLAAGTIEMIDPNKAGQWTDRGLILALLAMSFMTIGWLLRLLLKDRTKREGEHKELLENTIKVNQAVLAFLEEEKEWRAGLANRALEQQFEAGQRHPPKTRTSRVLPRDKDSGS